MEGTKLIQQFTKRWQSLRALEAVLYGIGAGICVGLTTQNIVWGMLLFCVVAVVALVIIRPWQLSNEKSSRYIDDHLNTAEYSSSLLLTPAVGLSGLAQLQREKITTRLASEIKHVKPQTKLKKAILAAAVLALIGVLMSVFYTMGIASNTPNAAEEPLIVFQATDSVVPAYEPPVVLHQKVMIAYPAYTQMATNSSSDLNVKVVEGTRLSWKLGFNQPVREVRLEGLGEKDVIMTSQKNGNPNEYVTQSMIPQASGYYNVRFTDSLGAQYVSDLYSVEVVKDKAPTIEIKDIPQFTSFDFDDDKVLNFTAEMVDDFGLKTTFIIATVSKGAGESVKFREEKLAFDQKLVQGSKKARLSKNIRLDELKMELGDELYFYVEVQDQKTPIPNSTRSETFFAVIKDTVSDGFGVEGTMGADLMPDYFRSQRQLIIDTEKLISERNQIPLQEFKSRSNELGFDQKALRLKYGKFMGDEADSGIAVTPDIEETDFDPDDPTANYRHDHDSENEHNLVEEHHDEHEHEGEEDEEDKSGFEAYMHDHDNPEESTLFTASLKGKLKNAMAQMWDAELYLRLAEPEKSLPYQYKALKLIQEIKNSARIYVHRIGFDPPPIKEEKRLSGDLDEIDNFYKQQDMNDKSMYAAMQESVTILEKRLTEGSRITAKDRVVFAQAGKELAALAIEEPSKHLKTLQELSWLTEEKPQPIVVLESVRQGLLQALPDVDANPVVRHQYRGALEKAFIQELKSQ
ncbi:tryptophan-rich sensory protein [Dokdonia ponticola]|uniref:Tryptophan-rich sensory protein n=1 Tax=Dokdonia ponticola TaxID=2041041 RepID=A0ABV9HYL1_9FLAO